MSDLRTPSIPVVRLVLLGFVLAAALAVVGCGEDDERISASALEGRLLPPSAVPGFRREQAHEWKHPGILTANGLFLPESTPPTTAIDALEDAGFEAAAGEELVVSEGEASAGPRIFIDVIRLGSDDEAREVLALLHKEDLKQPYAAACIQNPGQLRVPGIPSAKGAQQVPQSHPPTGAPPPVVTYAVEFAIGPDLYVVNGSGEPGQLRRDQVLDAAKAQYDHARGEGKA